MDLGVPPRIMQHMDAVCYIIGILFIYCRMVDSYSFSFVGSSSICSHKDIDTGLSLLLLWWPADNDLMYALRSSIMQVFPIDHFVYKDVGSFPEPSFFHMVDTVTAMQ